MGVTIRRRPRPEWRPEPGPGYDLRQYDRGRPTGLVAVMGWDHGTGKPPGLHGPDVRLFRDRATLVIEEHQRPGNAVRGVELRVPVSSCVTATLDDEPGLPGTALVRLVLVVRLGRQATFRVPLWFPSRSRRFLQQLVDEVSGRAPGRTTRQPAPRPALVPLEVTRAPDDDDWITFRSADEGEAVLPRRPGRENEVGNDG
ncbi:MULTISPECIES: hypothetical protein [unclassified Amycolatopsis]|uniref:hypothetical protein n=1 Tax=unclassified Amycolatopsis TaxID=2618356 RepID=UPI002874878C|nr:MULTISPECIES: hypothetical protein [unclassified Amycolatopsis]MDS0133233.1 hypothetical protein [Amycolatopsis sp. 505]MDS0146463.1 hypothetical protein [Amycolatopsis sp. CM201R]